MEKKIMVSKTIRINHVEAVENYLEEEIKMLIDRLCGSLSINPENFLRDIHYEKFLHFRSDINGFYGKNDLI